MTTSGLRPSPADDEVVPGAAVAPAVGKAATELAIRLVLEARGIAVEAFAAGFQVTLQKPDGSPVTETDLAIEDLLRRRLAVHFPDDGVLGEERGVLQGTSGSRWVMDPLGGTADFIRRIPLFCIDLAREDEYGPAIAVSDLPMSRVMLAAGRGLGSWVLVDDQDELASGSRAMVDGRTDLDGAVVCAHNLKGWSEELLGALHRRVALRDGVHSVRKLITGEVQAIVLAGGALGYDDLACLPVLVEEAGGRVTDLSGRPVLEGDGTALATNGILHDDFLELVRGLPTGR